LHSDFVCTTPWPMKQMLFTLANFVADGNNLFTSGPTKITLVDEIH
jgi:hypothetical protein